MKKVIFSLIFILTLSGCVTVHESVIEEPDMTGVITPEVDDQRPVKTEEKSPQEEIIEQVEAVEPEIIKGVIFGKTRFEGVLENRDVRLFFQSLENPQLSFQFQISEPNNEEILPWNVKRLDPGYFFIELPIGEYQIAKVSIFVGTTLASEDIDVKFVVGPEMAVYLGTLSINGTKERIKLGGVPVIQPGFDYEVEIIDEQQEAERIFNQRFPNLESEIFKDLMQISSSENP